MITRAQLIAIAVAGSVALHVGIAASVASIKKAPVRRGPTAISVRESKKKLEAKKESPREEPKPIVKNEVPLPAKKAAPPAKAAVADAKAAPATAAAEAPMFGGSFGNGGTITVPTGGGGGAGVKPVATASAAPQEKVLVAKANVEECSEPPSKPKPLKVVQPAYTESAREAQVEGRVRVEITIDETGRVAGAKVLQGLGHGLDEAALSAAKSSTFAAATRCGRPIAATFVIGMRFNL